MNVNEATRRGINALIILGIIGAVHVGQSILIPTVIALLFSAMLWPAVRWMHQHLVFSWGFASVLAVLGLLALNLFITLALILAVPKLLQDLPDLRNPEAQEEIYNQFRDRLATIAPLDDTFFPAKASRSRVFQYVKDTLENDPLIGRALWQMTYYGNIWLWQWALIMFLLLFLLMEGPMLSRRLVEIFGPSEDAKGKAVSALTAMAHQVRTYLVWRTIVNFGLGLLVGLVYHYAFHLRQAWTWAFLTSILFYVPYLGPLIAGVFPVIEAFIANSPWSALGVIVVYGIVITVEGYLIVPVVMGHSLELNATTVMLACLFWDLVWGLPGLFLAVPLMAALKAICLGVPDWKPWANLMSTSAAESRMRGYTAVVSALPVKSLAVEQAEAVGSAQQTLAD